MTETTNYDDRGQREPGSYSYLIKRIGNPKKKVKEQIVIEIIQEISIIIRETIKC